MTSRCWVFGQRVGKTEAVFFSQAVVFYGKIDIFAQISIWTEKTGEYCLPKCVTTSSTAFAKKVFISTRGMKLQQPWSRGHIPSCSTVTQHRPWAVGGSASAPTILWSHHTCSLPYLSVSAHHTSEPPYLQAFHTRQYQLNHTSAAYMHHSRRPTILTSRPILLSNL